MFIEGGIPKLVREEGEIWTRGDGYTECSGVGNFLWAGKAIGEGDFRIEAELEIHKLGRSAASFVIDGDSHFGFEGSNGQLFVQGPVFGGATKFLGEPNEFVREGEPFRFEVARAGTKLEFIIDGKVAHTIEGSRGRLGTIAFRPWRSTMRIREFRAGGELMNLPPPRSQPTNYTIPTLDLALELERQVIVETLPGQYLGHPTTVLLADDKTMLCTYPLGHGGPAAVLKRSEDGGLTWSERLPVPENWATATNCPCLHRLTGPDGVERLFNIEGNGAIRQAVSLDNGETWTPFEPNGMHGVVAPITILPIEGGRHLAMYQGHGEGRLKVWQSISKDGGLTWGPERMIAEHPWAHLCEPAMVRSPDGKQIAAFMRENLRRYNSFLITSDDDGETWSEPIELPASLTGDRHLPRYAPDGRLVIPFRDMAKGSPTYGDFAAWVGTYEDAVSGREGQYRVRLLDSPVKVDLGYPGFEVLPDGTLVITTYAVLKPGEKHSVVSVRFSIEELDMKAAIQPEQQAIFISGKEGYNTFRIPALIVSKKGTVLAFCEGRRGSGSDTGDIDIVLKR
ncbi:MAG TPA: sialidase family protein, partial [Armatimonadota bacterium]|nr:sialidase family protein [Armatimonadota bacterium]